MEFSIVTDNPTRKEIEINVPTEEVDRVFSSIAKKYQKNSQISGFRKGKAPINLIEQRFQEPIQKEAAETLYSTNTDDMLQKTGLEPVSRVEIVEEGSGPRKGLECKYKVAFDVLPTFEIPPYTGLEVEEEVHKVGPEQLDKVFERLRKSGALLKPADGNGPAKDGQVVTVDFQAFEDGVPVDDLKVTNYQLELGQNEALPEFEELVRGIPLGHTGEGEITFPEDFLVRRMAGKTVTMNVTVKEIKDYELLPLDDRMAKDHGFDSMDAFRAKVEEDLAATQKEMDKAAAQRKLLDQLLKQVDFPLPDALVDFEAKMKVIDMMERLQGRTPDSLGEDAENMLASARPYAENTVRSNILLTAIAKKEKLEVTDNELLMKVASDCLRHGEDVRSTISSMRENGMLGYLHQRMLADKAMDLIYERAVVNRKDAQPE